VLNDAVNFDKYDLSTLEKYYQTEDSQNCFNKVLFAPLYLPSGYKNVVYLDKPLFSLHTSANVYYADLICYNSFLKLSPDREEMVKCFEKLSCYIGKEFSDIVSFVIKHDLDNKKQIIFAYSVFSELGFFEVKNGRLYKNSASKNALTNSTLYCKISNIKG
jgi:ssDNA-specific exonuclease RecJ